MDHGICGKNAVNGVTEEEDGQRQQLGDCQRNADGGPDTAADLVQLPGADHVAQQDLGGFRHGDGVHIGHIGQHTAVDLGADHRCPHEVDEAENKGLGNIVGQGFCAGGQSDAQQGAECLCREGTQVFQGKMHAAFPLQGDAGQNQSHGFGENRGHGGPRYPHLGEAEEPVDEDGIACHVQKVHNDRQGYDLFEQGVAPQHGAQLDIQSLQQHGAAYNAGIEAGPVKGVRRRPQQLEHQFRLQQQEQPHQKAERRAE